MLSGLLAALAAVPAAAQPINPFAPLPVSTAPAANYNYAAQLGAPQSVTGGPWVVAETLFFSAGQVVSDYAWRDRLRGRRGQLYTSGDLRSDVEGLMSLNVFNRVTPAVYAIPNTPIPVEFTSISVSTSQVRVVFDVELKQSTAAVKPRLVTPPSAVSGLILTPTAYRGAGKHNVPGLGLDFNAAYFIGRLYGKNSYPDAPTRTNYIDRLGIWTMTADGKMQIQSDGPWRPAVAVGGQAMLVFRDSPQPTVATPAVSVKVNAKSTQLLSDAYIVASKNFHNVRYSAGMMQGNIGDLVANLSEFLTPEALRFYNHAPVGTYVTSRTVPFASVLYLRGPDYPIGVEVMKFNGSPANPILINLKLGRLLRLNFDLALLKFQGGYDLLGLFQFRFNQFPNK
jgi:hypothetical protein